MLISSISLKKKKKGGISISQKHYVKLNTTMIKPLQYINYRLKVRSFSVDLR